jgi:hypothetical protein
MQLSKCSLLLVLILLKSNAFAFSVKDCFSADFNVTVKHKGWPFGLSENVLNISKNKCDIYFSHERVKYLKSAWHIDVCREPVHIKKGSGAVEVIKKLEECTRGSSSAFCSEISKIKENVQNDGLIFAEGSKDELSSNHGKVYCAYSLIKLYEKGHILGDNNISKLNFLSHKIDKKREAVNVLRPVVEGSSNVNDEMEEELKTNDQDSTTEETKSSTTRTF